MKRGFEIGGKYSQDPIGSDKARGKDTFRRKSGRDPGLTPTEQHQKNVLMRQFMKNPEGPGGNGGAYKESEVWCREPGCRRMNGSHWHGIYPEATITQESLNASREPGAFLRLAGHPSCVEGMGENAYQDAGEAPATTCWICQRPM